MTLELLTLGQFTVALLMGLAALCAFFWAIVSGALSDVESTKYQVLRAESPPPPESPGSVEPRR